jgi:hypothetical protein
MLNTMRLARMVERNTVSSFSIQSVKLAKDGSQKENNRNKKILKPKKVKGHQRSSSQPVFNNLVPNELQCTAHYQRLHNNF